jgi:signal transduction histidine kinase/CheY-like chemotaxis protein
MTDKPRFRRNLFRKYAVYFAILVCASLAASGSIAVYFAYQDNKINLVRLQGEKATAAAYRIEQYIREIEHQIGWTVLLSGDSSLEQRRLDCLRLLRQVPSITEVRLLDATGREYLQVSRLSMDVAGSGKDYSQTPPFNEVRSDRTYFSPVYFRKETEPYMTIAMAGSGEDAGVTVAEVNLKFIWDVVSQIRVGQAGYAYVVDTRGQLVAHPDISLVLQKTDLSPLRQVRLARTAISLAAASQEDYSIAHNRKGQEVLTASAVIPALGWFVFVEQPLEEAFAPLYALIARIGVVLLAGLLLAVLASLFLARRMVTPIRALEAGAAQIGAGSLGHRIDVHTGDELEALAAQFNRMAGQLQESYANLEQRIEERTQQLTSANQAKTRFLAAASHDLRQPMHALGMFISQLRDMISFPEARKIVDHAELSVSAMESLLNALLDISRLDAGILTPKFEDFPVAELLARMENSFGPSAREKGLSFRVMPCSAWVHSDPVLLERILMNLVSNAMRYTERGGIVIGCRRRGEQLRIEVWDSGVGIPKDRQREIFQEFFQLANPERDRTKGLGLGLAIVERLARLLNHRLDLASTPGKGSVFAIELPRVEARLATDAAPVTPAVPGALDNVFVLVVDDEAMVREGMRGLLAGWGCHVVTAGSGEEAMARLEEHERMPDLIISDYRLPGGETGIDAIQRIQASLPEDIPALLISGDTAPERLVEAQASGYHLLHKPVQPAKLRALLSRVLAEAERARRDIPPQPV